MLYLSCKYQINKDIIHLFFRYIYIQQGMLTIGSTPDPGALHLTQGVVRVVVRGVSVIFSTIYIRILTFVSMSVLEYIYIISMSQRTTKLNKINCFPYQIVQQLYKYLIQVAMRIYRIDSIQRFTNTVLNPIVKSFYNYLYLYINTS